MSTRGGCEHCGARDDTESERMFFEGVGREIELELCEWCRQDILAEDGITPVTAKV